MASDLYRDIKNNPRTRSTGGVSDHDYKNYLAGMKPRSKNNNTNTGSSFVESAARVQTNQHNQSHPPRPTSTNLNKDTKSENAKSDEEKKSQEKNRALYTELSAVPQKKHPERNNQINNSKANNKKLQNNGDLNNLKQAQTDLTGSVDRLRSMFDKGVDEPVKLRTRHKRERPYSANFDSNDKHKTNLSGNNDRHSVHIQSLNVETLVGKDNTIDYNDEETEHKDGDSPGKEIDVLALLSLESSSSKSEESYQNANEINKKEEELDMQKRMEIDRMKRTQEEVEIEQKFNVKRRSLKERLSDLANGNESVPMYVSLDSPSEAEKKNLGEFQERVKNNEFNGDIKKPIANTVNQTDQSMSEVEKYKSAVERFDEFINRQENTKSGNSENNVTKKTDVNQNHLKLDLGEELSQSTDTDFSNHSEGDASDLMKSILSHMERSQSDSASLLRSSSRDDSSDYSNNKLGGESPKPMLSPDAPEVLPRLSKMQGRSPTSPPPSLTDEVSRDQVSSSATQSPQEDSSCYSGSSDCEDSYNVSYYLPEEIKLPPPPMKSNLIKSRADKKKSVVFNDKRTEEVVTYGPKEYDRANADIDPIASSAEWELEKRVENMDIFSVDLQKDDRGLGLSIIGLGVGTETGVEKLGIFVKTLTENGAAQRDGRIQVNDQILEVNGVSLVGVTQFFAAQTLKGTNGLVRFLMGREKTRRTQFSPGAPILDNPDIKKHIEETNKALAHMEELEQRALNAEHTLEEVKIELLNAEERAHEAEHNLKETKELLKAATESPFINNQRKLKNEIKKGAGRRNDSKLDDLQRSLEDVTNRLCASEENLLALSSENSTKDKELLQFKSKLDERADFGQKLGMENETLQNTVNKQKEEIEQLKSELAQLQDLLKKTQEENLAQKEIEVNVQKSVEDEQLRLELETRCQDLENTNTNLRTEMDGLKQQLNDLLQNKEQEHVELISKLDKAEKQLEKKDTEMEQLREKNDYLKSQCDKVNSYISREPTPDFSEEMEELKEQNENLKKKIADLEEELKAKSERPTTLSLQLTAETPEVPKRDQVKTPVNHIIGIKPPLVHRNSKPKTPESLPQTPESLLQNQENAPLSTDLVSSPPSEFVEAKSQNSSDRKSPETTESITVTSPSSLESITVDLPIIDFSVISPPSQPATPEGDVDVRIELEEDVRIESPNPIPKPPRGHFVSDSSDEDFVIVEKPNESPVDSPTMFTPLLNSPESSIGLNSDSQRESTQIEPSIESSTTNESPAALQSPVSPTLNMDVSAKTPSANLDESTEAKSPDNVSSLPFNATVSPIIVDLDALPEDKVDSEDDQGQFQLIQEDVEDEKTSTESLSRKNTGSDDVEERDDVVDSGRKDRQEFFDSRLLGEEKIENWLDDEWNRLDKEKEADLIAEQVALNSPSKRKISTASSSSEEKTEELTQDNNKEEVDKETRTHSLKMDTSYFKQSSNNESFDREREVSVLDDVDKAVTPADTPSTLPKTFSFSAIPDTPTLNSKVAQDRIQVAKNDKRKPPSKGARGQLAANQADEFQLKQNSLPRNLSHNILSQPQLSGAKSAPNLSEKHEKQKHKFFHIPKVFKKHKKTDKHSMSPNVSKSKLPKSISGSSVEISDRTHSPHESNLSVELKGDSERSGTPEVVPINEKVDSMNQEKANDASTEEAVVPFADKERLMADTESSTGEVSEISSSLRSASLHIEASPDDVTLEISAPSSRNSSSMDMLPKSGRASSASTEPVNANGNQYNERAIDIGGGPANGHTVEEDNITHWTRRTPSGWDVRQVGLWLVEMDLSMYVNSFKSHEVDGQALLLADGNKLKEYGVHNSEHRAEIKKKTKEFRSKLGKDSVGKDKHKSAKDKLQFWKGKYKMN